MIICDKHHTALTNGVIVNGKPVCFECNAEAIMKDYRTRQRKEDMQSFKRGVVRVLKLEQLAEFFKGVGK